MDPRLGNQLRTFGRVIESLRPAFRSDRNLPARIQKLLTGERRWGSRDRRLYRELIYTAVRFLPWFEEISARSPEAALSAMAWLAAPIPAVAALQEEVSQSYGLSPATIAEKAERLSVRAPLMPDWLNAECPVATISPNLEVLHLRAPLWLRLQTHDPGSVFEEFTRLKWVWKQSTLLPTAVEMIDDVDVVSTQAFARGKIEVQDLGSQLVLEAAGVVRGERWLDACAGAGGKTLQLATLVGPEGKIVAHDIRHHALRELGERARRAGFANIEATSQPAGLFDGVLVDAPCSGSGTWRRSPHLKNLTQARDIASAAKIQLEILEQFSAHVRPGGRLVYATCSLCQTENVEVVKQFLAMNISFSPIFEKSPGDFLRAGAGQAILPARQDSDGFFIAVLQRD